jgi:hypothetical protein
LGPTWLTVPTVSSSVIRILMTLVSGAAFASEGDVDAQCPQEGLGATQAAGGVDGRRLDLELNLLVRSRKLMGATAGAARQRQI